MRKKILFVVSDDKYVMSHRINLMTYLVQNGYEVSVVLKITDSAIKKQIEDAGCHVYDLQYRASGIAFFGNIKLFFKLIKCINKIKPTIVHAISMRMVFLSALAFYFSSAKKFVGSITGLGNLETSSHLLTRFIKKSIWMILRLLFLNRQLFLIVQNRDDFTFFKNTIINEKRLVLIRGSGVDCDYYTPQPEPASDKIIISVVSRMLKDKGIVDAIDAIKIASNKYPTVHLNLVGDIFPENPLSLTTADMKKLCDHPNITWMGHQTDILAIWKNSHIALLPSYREGLPKSLLEAAACARPIITTDVPGCHELVQNNRNGLLVPVKSPTSIADAIEKLVNHADLRLTFGKAGRAMIEDHFSDAIINAQFFDFYNTLLSDIYS